MATGKFSFAPDDDFLKSLGKLSEVEKVIPKMLEESAPIVVKNMTSTLATKHSFTGAMAGSIKATVPKKGKKGMYTVIRPTGTDANGVRNMAKLMYTELGTSRHKPMPCLESIKNDSEEAVLAKMQEVFERETGSS